MFRDRFVYIGCALVALVACTAASKKGFVPTNDGNGPETNPGDESDGSVLQPDPSGSQQDIGDHPAPEGGTHAEGGRSGGSKEDPPMEGGTVILDGGGATEGGTTTTAPTYCTGPLAAGDVRVVELMIKASTDAADDGEWVELQSARDCILKLGGVVIESPWGADGGVSGYDSVTLPDNFELQPNDIFVAADTDDTDSNHGITPVFSFDSANVLEDTGDKVTIRKGTVIIDAFTYPAFSSLPTARSVSFPADCAWSQRADFSNWSYSFDTYATGFIGTPNLDNIDVACP